VNVWHIQRTNLNDKACYSQSQCPELLGENNCLEPLSADIETVEALNGSGELGGGQDTCDGEHTSLYARRSIWQHWHIQQHKPVLVSHSGLTFDEWTLAYYKQSLLAMSTTKQHMPPSMCLPSKKKYLQQVEETLTTNNTQTTWTGSTNNFMNHRCKHNITAIHYNNQNGCKSMYVVT